MFTFSQQNKAIHALYRMRLATIPELAHATRVHVPAVTGIVRHLVEQGLVRAKGRGSSDGGRPAMQYALCGERVLFVAVAVERFAMRLALVNLAGRVVTPIASVGSDGVNNVAMLKLMQQGVRRLINRSGVDRAHIAGIGIALPSCYDRSVGVSLATFCEAGVDAQELLGRMFPYPVCVQHDMNVVAMAEFRKRSAGGLQNLLYVNLGAVFGLGMVVNGRVFAGAGGLSSNVVHIPLLDSEKRCYCGQTGCLATALTPDANISLAHDSLAIPLVKVLVIAMYLLSPQEVVVGIPPGTDSDAQLQTLVRHLLRYATPQMMKQCKFSCSPLDNSDMLLGNIGCLVDRVYG